MEGEVSQQPKQERSRTRWTASLDKIFADIVVKQIQLGNRPNNVFDKKTWSHIRDEFNRQTDLNFNTNQLRKHLDVLRTRFYNLKSAADPTEIKIDDSYTIGFDLWEEIAVQPRPETIKVKDSPIYEQLCTIFSDSASEGKYAQSSHYKELEKSVGTGAELSSSCPDGANPQPENPSPSGVLLGNVKLSENMTKTMMERKRKRTSESQSSSAQTNRDQELYVAMAEALLEMVAASKRKFTALPSSDRFSISNCIRALDEIGNVEESLYFAAVDLFEDPSLRETFISVGGDKSRLTWLQAKCGMITHGIS